MKLTFFGLAITSSWGNGHATTYRALCNALAARGHDIVFFEQDAEWYANNRDVDGLPKIKIVRYETWADIRSRVVAELLDSDVAIIGSYFPHAYEALHQVLSSRVPVKAFYDIDTPVTLSQLRESGHTAYLRARDVRELDIYFSFTGGPALLELQRDFGARRAVALYCSVQTGDYRPVPVNPDFTCAMSYMGTFAPDRQPKIENLLCDVARRMQQERFIVAGPQYPGYIHWPSNVLRIEHLEPKYHPQLYCSSRLVLNATRRDMVMAGYSPSVRLFEAAACASPIVSDNWPGLDEFFTPGKEILLATSADDVVRYLRDYSAVELQNIGAAGRDRILAQHTSAHRALEFEAAICSAMRSHVHAGAVAH